MWVAGLAFLGAGVMIRASLRALQVLHYESRRWWWARRAATGTAWVLVPVAAAFGAFDNPSFVVVEPAGSGGCRAVVSESAFLFIGWGSVHVAGGWGPFAPQVGSYKTDDGIKPVSAGEYRTSWDDASGGVLSVEDVLSSGDGMANGGTGFFGFDC